MKAAPARLVVPLALVTACAYFVVSATGRAGEAIFLGGFIPARVGGLVVPGALPVWLTPLSATLLHGGLLHLGLNLLTLVYCGREDEVALGSGAIGLLYLIGAFAAAAGQYVASPASLAPMIGASGAVSALVGAYAVLYGQRRPSRLPPELARWVHIAWLALAWMAIQLLVGIASSASGIGIAAAAHVGGFLAGVLLARPLLRWRFRRA